jgi:hypothetical protein
LFEVDYLVSRGGNIRQSSAGVVGSVQDALGTTTIAAVVLSVQLHGEGDTVQVLIYVQLQALF